MERRHVAVEEDMERHIQLAKEKLQSTVEAYQKERYSVVGDEAIKVVEEAIEAHAAKLGDHLRDHAPRFEFFRKYYGPEKHAKLQSLFNAYTSLGYEGWGGKEKAEWTVRTMFELLEAIEKRSEVVICESKQLPKG